MEAPIGQGLPVTSPCGGVVREAPIGQGLPVTSPWGGVVREAPIGQGLPVTSPRGGVVTQAPIGQGSPLTPGKASWNGRRMLCIQCTTAPWGAKVGDGLCSRGRGFHTLWTAGCRGGAGTSTDLHLVGSWL